jgi:hypothetical protein
MGILELLKCSPLLSYSHFEEIEEFSRMIVGERKTLVDCRLEGAGTWAFFVLVQYARLSQG